MGVVLERREPPPTPKKPEASDPHVAGEAVCTACGHEWSLECKPNSVAPRYAGLAAEGVPHAPAGEATTTSPAPAASMECEEPK